MSTESSWVCILIPICLLIGMYVPKPGESHVLDYIQVEVWDSDAEIGTDALLNTDEIMYLEEYNDDQTWVEFEGHLMLVNEPLESLKRKIRKARG